MNDGLETLLDRLADGKSHSGPALAEHLGISRAAVWKRIEQLRALGLKLEARPGGYQLSKPLTRLDSQQIANRLDRPDITVECRFLVDSTNARLAEDSHHQQGPRVLLAEAQSAGRGRRGREWRSPPGSGIYLSLTWRFQSGLTGLSALSLVTGIAAARVLREFGVGSIGLKWPNDLVVAGCKLGGCLIDISGSAEGPCDAIIGLGINVDLGEQVEIDQPWIEQLGLSLHQLETGSIELPVKPAYPALGCDRWLALQWAWLQTRAACCIVDCGTAVTVDAIDDRGRHLGGWIMTGLASLRSALGQSARHLPPASPEPGPLNRPARDTSTAIGAGTLVQLVGGIEHAIDSLKSGSDARFESDPAVWLTGGDAAAVQPHLSPPVQYDPHLVLRGLGLASRSP